MLDFIVKTIKEYVEIKPGTVINEKTNIRADIKINSYDLANIITAIEDEFDIVISERDIINFQVIGDLIKYIEKARESSLKKTVMR